MNICGLGKKVVMKLQKVRVQKTARHNPYFLSIGTALNLKLQYSICGRPAFIAFSAPSEAGLLQTVLLYEESNENLSILRSHVEIELSVKIKPSPFPFGNLFTRPTSWFGFL